MAGGNVSASEWVATRNLLNTLINDCNTVFVSSYTGTISPPITLEAAQSPISRTVAVNNDIRAAHYSDADGLVTKYNNMRKYDSCRYRDAGTTPTVGTWHYGYIVSSANLLGRRDGSFPTNTPPYITPPAVNDTIQDIVAGRDILDIINDGTPIHRSTILGLAPGTEYVVIDNCHSQCHSSCHGRCNRSKR